MKGFSLIELIITICIIGIISGIFYNIAKSMLDMHDLNYKENNVYFALQNISKQIKDEVRHGININSQHSKNLNLITYDSSDTSLSPSAVTCISYNFINNKLYKYNERFGDTGCFNIEFDSISFYVSSKADSLTSVNLIDRSKNKFYFQISKRN